MRKLTVNCTLCLLLVMFVISCKKKNTTNPNLPVANFTIAEDTIQFGIGSNLVFDFTNTSTNATSYRWDFGGSYTATTVNGHVVYTAADLGIFFSTNVVPSGSVYHSNHVKLVAKNGNDSSVVTKTIVVQED